MLQLPYKVLQLPSRKDCEGWIISWPQSKTPQKNPTKKTWHTHEAQCVQEIFCSLQCREMLVPTAYTQNIPKPVSVPVGVEHKITG